MNQQCSNDALLQLSTKIADYNGFKVRLGLSDAEINAIDLTISDIPGRFYTALKRWKSKGMFDSTATYGRLMEIAKKKEDGEAFQSILSACIEHASKLYCELKLYCIHSRASNGMKCFCYRPLRVRILEETRPATDSYYFYI